MTPRQKLDKMKRGASIVTNDDEFDAMLALGDDAIYEVRSVPNPNRVGVKDQYVAWIGDIKTIGETIKEMPREEKERLQQSEYKRGWQVGLSMLKKNPKQANRWELGPYRDMEDPTWFDMGKADVIAEHRAATGIY